MHWCEAPVHKQTVGQTDSWAATNEMLLMYCSRSSTKSIIFPYNIWGVCERVRNSVIDRSEAFKNLMFVKLRIIDPNREKSSIWSTRPILIGRVFCLLFNLWANLTQKACNHLLYILYSGKLLADTREAPASCKEGSHSLDRCKQSTYGHPQKG